MLRQLDAATSAAFRLGARLRRARAFHPVGAAYRATLEVHGSGAEPALRAGTHPAVVRFSRGIGLPPALPDIHGVALRVPDAHGPGSHQDLLVSSVLSPGLGRHVLRLGTTVSEPFYSSIAPYRGPSGRLLVGMRAVGAHRYDLAGLEDAVWAGRCRLEVCTAGGTKAWDPVAVLAVHADRLTDDEERALGFDPWNTAPGFQPAGWVNRWRRPAYPASRAGRPGAEAERATSAGP